MFESPAKKVFFYTLCIKLIKPNKSDSDRYRTLLYGYWIQEGADTIGNVQVRQIDARTTDGFVAVATYGNGIYSAYFENAAATIPEYFVLKQNYPNPFNLETQIEFTLPKSSNVTVKIYNILG